MLALWKKEIMSYFGSMTGYLVAGVFLVATALFLWFIPGNMNIPMGGYATLEPLFWIAPWIYLFLVPATTMRLFAEEKRNRTIELLLTHPVSEWRIVFSKYFAGLTLVIISLLPTLVFYYSVNQLASPVGNLDHGAIWGSYFGLVLLAAIYVAIGVFTSALGKNQIIAFVLAVVLCYFFYDGFAAAASLPGLEGAGSFLSYMGIAEHYDSISRGVLDSRDLLYFVSVSVIFLWLTRTVLSRR